MKTIKTGLFFSLTLVILASCSSDEDELGPTRDVAYFMEHEEERKAVIEKCANDPGRLKFHPNCENAAEALFKKQLTGSRAVSRPPTAEQLLRGHLRYQDTGQSQNNEQSQDTGQ